MASPASATSTTRERTFGETFNRWVQTIGIIVAAAWGAYTFIYKEITLPKSAPINITMNMQLKRVGTGKPKGQFVAVEMRVVASNPSPRVIYLLPSYWAVFGYRMTPIDDEPLDSFYSQSTELMNAQGGDYVTRHADPGKLVPVAAGSLFGDNTLNPNETLSRTIILHIPRDKFDVLEAHTVMPTSTVERRIALQWTGDEKTGWQPNLYLVNAQGERKLMTRDKEGNQVDARVQMAQSDAELSLWQ